MFWLIVILIVVYKLKVKYTNLMFNKPLLKMIKETIGWLYYNLEMDVIKG